jgi:single-stranded-DNA-specific exonuclease
VQIDMPFKPEPDGPNPDSGASMPAPEADIEPSAAAAPCPDDSPVGVLTGRPWQAKPQVDPEVIDVMRRELPLDFSVSDRLLTLLAIRGLTNGRALEGFFYPTVEQIPDPFLLKEMDTATERTFTAVRAGETVAVHGDFDVDGITGCAVLTELLRTLHLDESQVRLLPAFIPERAADGYGIAGRMIDQWARAGVTLLVTVDTGAAAHAEIAQARDAGIDVIVLDHHIFDSRPPAVALVNPRRSDATYPNRELCGVAVAFKYAQALLQREPGCLPDRFLASVLDLVALGLVADQMDLVGENRILVRKGLEKFADRLRIRPGLAALLQISGLDRGFPVTAADLAYQIAPRLNACGRIGRVMTALELLLTRDVDTANRLAQEADRTNTRRKQADLALKEEAIDMAVPYVERRDPGLVLASSAWHKGVIGIGAARLVEQFQLPTILIAVEGDEARGSARSVADIDVKTALDRCRRFLVRHGGHAQAAGLTLRTQDIPEFREEFLRTLADEQQTGPVPERYDLDLALDRMTAQAVADQVCELEQMEPFGAGNRKPIFRCCALRLLRLPTAMSQGAHLRFAFAGPAISDGGGTPALSREFVAFGAGEAWRRMLASLSVERDALECRWDILFQIGRSTYRPRGGLYDPVQQLLVDIRPAASP